MSLYYYYCYYIDPFLLPLLLILLYKPFSTTSVTTMTTTTTTTRPPSVQPLMLGNSFEPFFRLASVCARVCMCACELRCLVVTTRAVDEGKDGVVWPNYDYCY